jgi:uncharacterized protein (TIGR02598 family)
MIPLFGLLPVGMQVFREAIGATIQTQIVQQLATLAAQTEFSDLDGKIATKVNPGSSDDTVTPRYFYFDDEGESIPPGKKENAIYTAALTYIPTSSLPAGASTASMITLRIDVYNNHGVFAAGKPIGRAKATFIHVADFGSRL